MEKINILNQSRQEAMDYLKTLKTSNHFTHLIERYAKIHNKGIFVDFSYNSRNAVDLFDVLLQRYASDAPLLTGLRKDFSRNKVVKIKEIEKRMQQKERAVEKRHRDFKEFDNTYQHLLMDLKSEIQPEHKSNLVGVEVVLGYEKQEYEKESQNLKSAQRVIHTTLKNRRILTSVTHAAELIYLKLVVDFYMKRVESYLRGLFGTERLHLSYHTKDFLDRYKNVDYPRVVAEGLSPFEGRLMKTLEDCSTLFSVQIFTEEQIYKFSEKQFFASELKEANKKKADYPLIVLDEQLQQLYLTHPDFYIYLKIAGDMDNKHYEQSEEYLTLRHFLLNSISKEVIEEYNHIVKEMQKIKQPEQRVAPKRKPLPSLSEHFPDLQFEFGQELDLGYKFGLNEVRYNTVFVAVSNDRLTLSFYPEGFEEKVLDEESRIPRFKRQVN